MPAPTPQSATGQYEAPRGYAAEQDPQASIPPTPLGWLAHLAANGDISPIERDAGEIFHRMGRIAINDAPRAARLQYPWRDAAGLWTTVTEPKRLVVDKYDKALAAAGTDARRKAIVAALVAREPALDLASPGSFSSALEAIAAHWWGGAAVRTVVRNGITLPDSTGTQRRAIDYDTKPANDNTPTAERVQHGRDNFERLLVRGQIDEDKEVAATLYAAGLRYETEHGLAYASGYSSPDYAKPVVDGSGGTVTPITERAEVARGRIREARKAMGEHADVVDAVVIHGMTLEAAGRRYCGYRSAKMASAAASVHLNSGLRVLAVLYGVAVRRAA